MTTRIKGGERFKSRLRGMRASKEQIGLALFAGADRIKAEAQHLITRNAVSGKGHVASRPGEPPKNDTGVLKGNIEATRTGETSAQVASRAPYAAVLQYGGSKVAARPYMDVAAHNKRDEVIELVGDAVRISIRRSTKGK